MVVNGVDQESAGGYHSQYRYGYTGYRYAYNYSEGYGTYGSEQSETKAIKEYYEDDTPVGGPREEAESAFMIDAEPHPGHPTNPVCS